MLLPAGVLFGDIMNSDDIEKSLQNISDKLDLLIKPPEVERAPVLLYSWLSDWYAVYKAPLLSAKYLGVLRCNIERIKASTENKPLNLYTPRELLQVVYNVPLSYSRYVVYSILKSAYNQAIRLGYTSSNPMDGVPPVKHYRQRGRALTVEQQRQFLQAIENDKYKPLYMFYLLTGCRRAEALSVKWSDVDFERKQIHIHGTKTPRADRYIPLFPQICAVLAQMPRSNGFIFPYSVGAVKGYFRRLQAKHGFTFRLHDLRHTFATRCIESGINLSTVSKWLGHSSVGITADIYVHVLTDFERAEVRKFDPRL